MSKYGIFKNAFDQFVVGKYFLATNIKKSKKINLFIDVTKITNKYGFENTAINGKYKKNIVTHISMIADEHKFPLGMSTLNTNKNNI